MLPKRMPSGQVIQENYMPGGIDQKEKWAETGPDLKQELTEGKSGSVEKKNRIREG